MPRTAHVSRNTHETQIDVVLSLDGGPAEVSTGVGFFDHMLHHVSKHGRLGLKVVAQGDTHIDDHHTVEDVGIALGEALVKAIGDKHGIERYGHAVVPMDEALAQCTVDLSGRPHLVFAIDFKPTDSAGPALVGESIGRFDLQLVREFMQALANHARMNLHVTAPYGDNNHHLAEAAFKALGRALRQAVAITGDELPSTKGAL
ncbi:MAG: imidazoleglycerol-phosphate dehydratase HisB [Planctomycetota bacterium]